MSNVQGLLILPMLRVQNANAISSPLTWGFPPMTAFFGFMWNLERKLGRSYSEAPDRWYADVNEPRARNLPLHFHGVGVICHSFEPQASGRYERSFHLTRNPLDKDGATKSIAQEGRAHLELTIVLSVGGEVLVQTEETRRSIASLVMRLVETMRIAGGTIVPSVGHRRHRSPQLLIEEQDPEKRISDFGKLKRSWLPGSALVLRDDLLHETNNRLKVIESDTTLVDALLYHSRINYRAHKSSKQISGEKQEQVEWSSEKKKGWVVPIPVGYCSLSEIYKNEQVKGCRDDKTTFRFVESIYSLGEWIGTHRLEDVRQILWHPSESNGIYRCNNNYRQQQPQPQFQD